MTLHPENVKLYNPFMSFADEETLTKRLEEIMKEDFDIPASEVKAAVHVAWQELANARNDMRKKGEENHPVVKRQQTPRYRTCRPVHIILTRRSTTVFRN